MFYGMAGGLLPDIDHPKSVIGRYNPLNWVKVMKHRGKCHTMVGCLLLSLPFVFFHYYAFIFALYGAVTHIYADKLYSYFPGRAPFYLKIW